ncbi:MAG TPA: hypothetical protein VFN06_04670, partial [Gaiellaceae bacterium]|nr:hypothetical protein [Gaiellaceae bacterium]
MTTGAAARVIDSPVGTIGVESTAAGLRRVRLPGDETPGVDSNGDGGAAANTERAAAQIEEYLRGDREEFDVALDWTGVDDTHRHVLETLREIAPFGTTVTYGELGRRAGVDDPRDVGVLMA